MQPKADILAGIHSVASALSQVPDQVSRLFVSKQAKNRRVFELVDIARTRAIPVEMLEREEIEKKSGFERSQDILAEFNPRNILAEKELPGILQESAGDTLLLVLDGIQDPHNLGACLRTASAAGVHAVILPKDRSAGMSPVVRRAAAGAAEIIPIVFVTNLARALKALKKAGVWLYGADDQAETSIYQANLTGPMALVMGSEGAGMRRLTSEVCDFQVRIPMTGAVSSLNVSVATGISLFEICRQRGTQ
jgi:23S rRNA (guanosine2251-2'-O)-methyltransferase